MIEIKIIMLPPRHFCIYETIKGLNIAFPIHQTTVNFRVYALFPVEGEPIQTRVLEDHKTIPFHRIINMIWLITQRGML